MAVLICLRDSERALQEQNTLYRKNGCKQVLKTFLKMLKDAGMAQARSQGGFEGFDITHLERPR